MKGRHCGLWAAYGPADLTVNSVLLAAGAAHTNVAARACRSHLRGGAAFIAGTLPPNGFVEKPVSSPNYPDPPGATSLSGLRILVVEDSWHVAKAMTRLLTALGADLAGPAATAAQAKQLISESRPDVALVDLNLRNGEPAHDLIDHLQDQGIRVIVITGYEFVPLEPGKVDSILQKPVNAAQLLAAVRQVMSH